MTETTPSPLNNVITIDDDRIKSHLDRVVRGSKRKVEREVRRFPTTTQGLLARAEWLESAGCTHVAMEATGVYWKPVWHILEGRFALILANAAHVKQGKSRVADRAMTVWRTGAWSLQIVKRSDAAGFEVLPKVDRRTNIRIDQSYSGSRLRTLRNDRCCIYPPRNDPHYAQATRCKCLLLNPNFPDRL
jgi:hypothetical protein